MLLKGHFRDMWFWTLFEMNLGLLSPWCRDNEQNGTARNRHLEMPRSSDGQDAGFPQDLSDIALLLERKVNEKLCLL